MRAGDYRDMELTACKVIPLKIVQRAYGHHAERKRSIQARTRSTSGGSCPKSGCFTGDDVLLNLCCDRAVRLPACEFQSGTPFSKRIAPPLHSTRIVSPAAKRPSSMALASGFSICD